MVQPAQVTVSAPGKLILMGEHAAVFGRPALVAALGLRTRARLGRRGGGSVRLKLPDLGVDQTLDWSDIVAYGDEMRRAWRSYVDAGETQILERMRAADPAHVVKIALAETLRDLGVTPPGIEVGVGSELPLGAGFGSSASVAVATVGGLLALMTGVADPARVEVVALQVERRQHGRPSGVDHGTVIRGGVQWMERDTSGELRAEALELAPRALAGLQVFDTGRPNESTGEMVESVRRRFEGRSEDLESLLDGMETSVRRFRDLLTGAEEAGGTLVGVVRAFESHLEALGVVPQPVCRLIREVEAVGGAAKISGAGGLTGSAGSLIAYHPEERVEALEVLRELRPFEAELGVAGLELEELQ